MNAEKLQKVIISKTGQSKQRDGNMNFVNNRPDAVSQKKLKDMIDAGSDITSNTNYSKITQLKFHFEPIAAKDITDTALKRVWDHALTKEIEESDNWHAEVKYVDKNYSADVGYLCDGEKSLGLGAKLELPQKEDEHTDQLEALKKKNEVTTLHELVHARAIFNKEFDVRPKVFHTVYKNHEFEGRELIPLEEALTVGFNNSGEYSHTLHREDTLQDLSTLDSEAWRVFASNMESRYKRIYGKKEGERNSVFTDNAARLEKGVTSREFYAEEARGKDEAWHGIANKQENIKKKEIEAIHRDFEVLKGKFEILKVKNRAEVTDLIKKHNDDVDSFDLFSLESIEEPSEEEWGEYKDAFGQQLDEMETIKTKVKEKGKLEFWRTYKEKFENLNQLKFYKYIQL